MQAGLLPCASLARHAVMRAVSRLTFGLAYLTQGMRLANCRTLHSVSAKQLKAAMKHSALFAVTLSVCIKRNYAKSKQSLHIPVWLLCACQQQTAMAGLGTASWHRCCALERTS